MRADFATSRPEFDGDYRSAQFSFTKRMADRWSGRLAYTVQSSHYVGTGNPDARRVWLDNDIDADYGRFASDRRQVFAGSASYNVWKTLNIATVISAISGSPINETVGRDVNGDGDNNDRPIPGIDDLAFPIRSELDSQGRAVINGLDGPGSFLVDLSFRYPSRCAPGCGAWISSTTCSTCSTARTWCRRAEPLRRELHDSGCRPVPAADAVRDPRSILRKD